MGKDLSLSIANLSCLSKKNEFLLQVSNKSDSLEAFIEDNLPLKEKEWLSDLNSWKINIRWLLKISDICLKDYEQVFFDCGDELLDLNDPENYQLFREKIFEEMM